MPSESPSPVELSCHESGTGASPVVVVEPEHVMNRRGGSVLGKKTILKSDHFPGCQNKRLFPQIEGAPNYRQIDCVACLEEAGIDSGRAPSWI